MLIVSFRARVGACMAVALCSAVTTTADAQVLQVIANDDLIMVSAADRSRGVTGNLIADDVIPGGYPLAITWTPPQQGGRLTLSPTDGSYSYIPPSVYTGQDQFTYQICLPTIIGACSQNATVTVVIAPKAVADTFTGLPGQTLNGNVSSNDQYPAPGGLPYQFRTLSSPAASAGALTSFDGTTGAFTFTPASGFSGSTSFDYEICVSGVIPNVEMCEPTTARIRLSSTAGIQSVPTVSAWGLVALSPLLLGAARYARRRQSQRSRSS